ncbi:hypothetical protein C3L33_15122, partial [Rhododendron williamsianum]
MHPDLSAACQALMDAPPVMAEEENEGAVVREYKEQGGAQDKSKRVPVYVMMPLDSVTMGNTINRRKAMNASLQALKSAGVEGVMMDVWWGLMLLNHGDRILSSAKAILIIQVSKSPLRLQAFTGITGPDPMHLSSQRGITTPVSMTGTFPSPGC